MPSPDVLTPETKSFGMEKLEKGELQGVGEESPIEGVVVDWPESKQEQPLDGVKLQQRRCGRFRSRRCAALSCCGISVVIAIVCALFWPRDPEWKLVTLDVLTEAGDYIDVWICLGYLSK